jgi:hypothetical protein
MLMMLDISAPELGMLLMLSIMLVAVKIVLLAILSKKEIDHVRETRKFIFGFVFSVILLMICLVISRLIYIYFDFILTRLEAATFYEMPNVWYWKTATLIDSAGFSIFIFVTDYRIFKFKFKGLFAYIMMAFTAILFFYPVNAKADFDFLSTFLLSANCVAIIIPIFFLYLGRIRSPYQFPSLGIAIGIIFYAIGASITTESLITAMISIFGEMARLMLYFFSLIFKIAGLVMFSYGVVKFATKFSK